MTKTTTLAAQRRLSKAAKMTLGSVKTKLSAVTLRSLLRGPDAEALRR